MNMGGSKSLYYFFSTNVKRIEQGAWRPNTDICETKTHIVVSLEVPGVEVEDISVMEYGDRIVVRGVRRPQTARGALHYHQIEIVCGEFEKEIVLSGPLVGAEVEAVLAKGILSLKISKKKSAADSTERSIHIEAE